MYRQIILPEATTDIPIIFSAPMVQALLAGRKVQTRRLAWREWSGDGPPQAPKPTPWQRVKPGHRLWVRESVRAEESDAGIAGVRYLADDAWDPIPNSEQASEDWFRLRVYRSDDTLTDPKPVPSIHMPRWASRLTLTVTDVRIERLQDISEEDAKAEGVEPAHEPAVAGALVRAVMPAAAFTAHRTAFAHLWEALHGPGSWQANPPIVALTFSVAQRNIEHV